MDLYIHLFVFRNEENNNLLWNIYCNFQNMGTFALYLKMGQMSIDTFWYDSNISQNWIVPSKLGCNTEYICLLQY